jgi:AraC family transcriptional regulator of adaptative response / DNA-3-methyladenine glycosylase II
LTSPSTEATRQATREAARVNGVTTTGIYCLPTCSASPRSDHIVPFRSAAAAEAGGFRACFRCRPYRAFVPTRWSDPEVVYRATRLIFDGALDEGKEAELAARLGISGRHLRRLFLTHVGVTPTGLARSARAHLARQLLDDTDLSITHIAFATGFGSIRQFNRVMRELFHANPAALRAKRRKADRLIADGGLRMRIPFEDPLDWTGLLHELARRAIPGVEIVDQGGYRRVIDVHGDTGAIELRMDSAKSLLIRAHLPHWDRLLHITQSVRRLTGVDADAREAIAALVNDPTIGSLVQARPGLRVPGVWDPYEAAVRAVVAEGRDSLETRAALGRLVERLGVPVHGLSQLGLRFRFPNPNTILAGDLSGLGLGERAETAIRNLTDAVVSGSLDLRGYAPDEELVGSLLAVDGLTLGIAHRLAFELGERDVMPLSEHEVASALERIGSRSTGRVMSATDAWHPWRALGAMYLLIEGDDRGRAKPRAAERSADSLTLVRI